MLTLDQIDPILAHYFVLYSGWSMHFVLRHQIMNLLLPAMIGSIPQSNGLIAVMEDQPVNTFSGKFKKLSSITV